jgi:TFIIF-interacting CTD phosphatase-like protein
MSRNHGNHLVPIATLVVDLDETLVHCSVQRPDRFDFSCSFTYSDQTHHVCFFFLRRQAFGAWYSNTHLNRTSHLFCAVWIPYADTPLPKPRPGGTQVYVQVRPFAREFLSELSKHFEIVLFTGMLRTFSRTVP